MKNALTGAAAAFAAAMVALAVTGALRNYWPGPWWDAWWALHFYMDTQDGIYTFWLKQHNEHRIVLQRVIFWIDNRFFGGVNLFPLAANYAFVAIAGFVFWRFLRRTVGTARPHPEETAVAVFIAGWLFFWSQEANLAEPFQGEFFMAQLLPLCAFYWLAVSATQQQRHRPFIAACAFGVLSVGSLANGLLTLPLMAFYSIAMRQHRARTGILIALSLAMVAMYFHGYETPHGHHSIVAALHESPMALVVYILRYLGNPFFFAFGSGRVGIYAATLAGALLVAGTAWLAIRCLRSPRTSPFLGAALAFLLYIGATAVATAAGRMYRGMEGAYTSRYTTPSLMAWAALFTFLYADAEHTGRRRMQLALSGAIAILAVALLWQQRHALDRFDARLSNLGLAALALALDVRDDAYVVQLYPVPDIARDIARRAIPRGLSIFGHFPYDGLKAEVGQPFSRPGTGGPCVGSIDQVERIGGTPDMLRMQGWLFDPATHLPPRRVRFVSAPGITTGFALTGTPRPDVAAVIAPAAATAGFRGYVRATVAGSPITLFGERPDCRITLPAPVPK